nr:probable crossover junction endonuclease EME2 isoform X2 [Oryctolagus cuniculus]
MTWGISRSSPSVFPAEAKAGLSARSSAPRAPVRVPRRAAGLTLEGQDAPGLAVVQVLQSKRLGSAGPRLRPEPRGAGGGTHLRRVVGPHAREPPVARLVVLPQPGLARDQAAQAEARQAAEQLQQAALAARVGPGAHGQAAARVRPRQGLVVQGVALRVPRLLSLLPQGAHAAGQLRDQPRPNLLARHGPAARPRAPGRKLPRLRGARARRKRAGARAGSGGEAGPPMARAGCGRARGARRRPPTWEISDSDAEGPSGAAAGAGTQGPAAEALRPERALKRLAVGVDPAILEDAGADVLLQALGALGCQCRIEPQRRPRSLCWSWGTPDPCPRSAPPEEREEPELLSLLLLEPEEFLQGAARLAQASGPICSVPWVSPESPSRPHLAVVGLDAYLWSSQPSARGTQSPRSPEARGGVPVGRPEVQEALVLLQLWADMDVLLVASWQELSQHVCALTRALAQRPFKQHRESQAFSFCTAGRWAAGVRVTRDGRGLREAWQRQIMQFNRVSPAVAGSIVTAFPSPRLLQQALAACSTERERLGLLADLPVRASRHARPRKVGPDLSRRLCLFLSTANPDLLLDLGS